MNDDFQFYDSNLNLNLPSLGFDMKGIDFTSGTRNIDIAKNLNKNKKNEKKDEKIDTVKEYADFKNIPYESALYELTGGGQFPLKPVIPDPKDFKGPTSTLTKTLNFLSGGPINFKPEEVEIVDGKVVGKNRQKYLGRFTSGLADLLTFDLADFDRRGSLFGKNPISKLGGNVEDYATDFQLSKSQQEIIEDEIKAADKVESPAVGSVEEAEATLDFLEKNADRINKLTRDQRRAASVDALGQYVVTEPIRQAFLNRAADKAAARGIDIRGKLEQMPTTQQLIAGEKQKQRTAASDAFLKEAQAIAYLQQQANQFGTGGIRPSNVTFTT